MNDSQNKEQNKAALYFAPVQRLLALPYVTLDVFL